MYIVMIASECAPVAKVGGLGDVVFGLSRELEIRGVLETQQGTGTFISHKKIRQDEVERRRQLGQLVTEFVSRAGASGFTVEELVEELNERSIDAGKKRR